MATRATLALGAAALIVGCATTQPYSDVHAVTSGADAYTCAAGIINSLGYTVLDANKEAGFIKTEHRNTTSTAHVVMWGSSSADRLTVTVFDDPATKRPQLRVVANTVRIQEFGIRAGQVSDAETSENAKVDAAKIISTCAR